MPTKRSLTFGIYPGGPSGTEAGITTGPDDDPTQIERALALLQGNDGRRFIVRGYEPFRDSPTDRSIARRTPVAMEQYIHSGRRLDLVAQYQSVSGNVEGYLAFVGDQIRRYGPYATTLQVTEEANVVGQLMDGDFPNVREALVRGVIAAKAAAREYGYTGLRIGFNATPSFAPHDDFWASIGMLGGATFLAAVDYVGLDFFPDVFRPVAPDGEPGDLRQMVVAVLRVMREQWLPAAGIAASVPIHITENGWPTGPGRSERRQAEVVEIIVRTIATHADEFNIAQYTHFDLRDADSDNPDLFHQFGLLRHDYSPKPAFDTYRHLIADLGTA